MPNYFLDTYHQEETPNTGNYFIDKYHKEEPTDQKQPKTFSEKLLETWPVKAVTEFGDLAKGFMGSVYSGKPITTEEMIKPAAEAATYAMPGAMPAAASFVPATKTLLGVGGKLIGAARTSGEKIAPELIPDAVSSVRKAIPPGIDPYTAKGTFEQLGKLGKMSESKDPIDFQDVHNVRLGLEAVQHNAAKSTSETAATDLKASTLAKHALDDWLEKNTSPEVSGALREGNVTYAAGKAAEGLDKRQYRSELRADVANSGMNLGNTIRSNVVPMLLSSESRTLTPEIKAQAENVVHGSWPENRMRYVGNLLGGGGGLGQFLTSAISGGLAGFGLGGPTGAGIGGIGLPAIGTAAKIGANELAVSHLNKLSEMLRSQAPISQTMNRTNALAGSSEAALAAKQALIRALLTNPSSSEYNPLAVLQQ